MTRWMISLGAVLAAGVALTVGGTPSFSILAAADGHDAEARKLIEDLPVCYARGTDAIGRAVTAPANPDLNSTTGMVDPKFKEGLEYYHRCFAPNFSFTLSNRGVSGRTVPDPATRTPKTDPALQWANYVNNAFRGPGYNFTQHHMGSISSEVHGNEANITSYLIATHMFGPTAKRTGVNVVYGTYTDTAAKVGGRWMLTHRTLDSFYSLPLPAGQ